MAAAALTPALVIRSLVGPINTVHSSLGECTSRDDMCGAKAKMGLWAQSGVAAAAPAPARDMRSLVMAAQQQQQQTAAAPETDGLRTLQANRKYGGDNG